MDKFLLADNPLTGNDEAIICTVDPVAIIEVIPGQVDFTEGAFYQHFNYNGEPFTFRLHHYFTTEFDGEQHGQMVDKLFRKAWHWYMAVLKEFDNEKE